MLFIFIIKTVLLDSVFHRPKPHHFFVAEQTDEKKNTFQSGSPGLEEFFHSISHLAKAFQPVIQEPHDTKYNIVLIKSSHFTAMKPTEIRSFMSLHRYFSERCKKNPMLVLDQTFETASKYGPIRTVLLKMA